MKNITIKYKIILLVALSTISLFGLTCLNIYNTKHLSILDRQAQLRYQSETFTSLMNHYDPSLDAIAFRKFIISAVNSIRYDHDNYFFVLNQDGTLLINPTYPKTENFRVDDQETVDGIPYKQMILNVQEQSPIYMEYNVIVNGASERKLAYLSKIPNSNFIVGTGLLLKDIDDRISYQIKQTILIGILLFSLLAFVGNYILSSISNPIKYLSDQFNLISKGDFRISLISKRDDELGIMANSIDAAITNVRHLLVSIASSSQLTLNMADAIATSSHQVSSNINSQNEELEHLSTAMNQLSSTIDVVSENVESAATSSGVITDLLHNGSSSMDETVNNINQVSSQISDADRLVEQLKEGVLQIRDVINIIHDISEQTNLLALNAAIEAARAGDQGRGFAVVSDEVRHLAQRTQQSTMQIQKTIDNLTNQAIQTAKAMRTSYNTTENCVALALRTQEELLNIVEKVHSSHDMLSLIATATEEQNTVIHDVNINVASVHARANDILVSAHALSAKNEELLESAKVLNSECNKFKV